LHFEACYYQGIEYAIENKLKIFEPGAQGEHKISRGFLPTQTWSAHTINDGRFEPAIRDFCNREKQYMQQDCEELLTHSPYHS
jgi:predicted N-acyltransferase